MNLATYLPAAKEALHFFASTFVELAVLFIGISFLVGVIQEFIPPEKTRRLLSARGGRGYFVGAGLGALTPFCSCSTIPIMVGLLKARAGFGPTLAFLFTSPLVNPIIIGLFLVALGPKATLIYAVLALLMAVAISFLLEKSGFQRFVRREALEEEQQGCGCQAESCTTADESEARVSDRPVILEPQLACCSAAGNVAATAPGIPSSVNTATETTRSKRWPRILRESVQQFRSFLPYILIGVAIGSLAHGFVPESLIVRYAGTDNPLAVPFAAMIGVPLYVRVSAMIPIFMPLMAKGMSIGALVALTIGGAGASLPELIMLKRIFKAPLLAAFIASVMVIAVASGWVFNAVF